MILLIDDEGRDMGIYRLYLETEGYAVILVDTVDAIEQAVQELQTGATFPEGIELILLDVMMDPGRAYDGVDTEDGLTTGLYVYHDLRSLLPKVPIILLTNLRDAGAQQVVEPDRNAVWLEKIEYDPVKLAEFVVASYPDLTRTSGE